MARYNKIGLGPARENCEQVREGLAAADTTPGSYVYFASGVPTVATTTQAAQGVQLYICDAAYYEGYGVDDVVPSGDTLIAIKPDAKCKYAALLATGEAVTALDTALTMSATSGQLAVATVGTDFVVAYADEIYTNSTGSGALIRIRPAII